jgi:hypothetical protein
MPSITTSSDSVFMEAVDNMQLMDRSSSHSTSGTLQTLPENERDSPVCHDEHRVDMTRGLETHNAAGMESVKRRRVVELLDDGGKAESLALQQVVESCGLGRDRLITDSSTCGLQYASSTSSYPSCGLVGLVSIIIAGISHKP